MKGQLLLTDLPLPPPQLTLSLRRITSARQVTWASLCHQPPQGDTHLFPRQCWEKTRSPGRKPLCFCSHFCNMSQDMVEHLSGAKDGGGGVEENSQQSRAPRREGGACLREGVCGAIHCLEGRLSLGQLKLCRVAHTSKQEYSFGGLQAVLDL